MTTNETSTLRKLDNVNDGSHVPQGQACLVQIYPLELNAGLLKISENPFIIGRGRQCGLTLEGDSVSRKHCAIHFRDDAYFIRDLQSTNGTFVNDQANDEVRLRAGDRIRIGNQIFKFLSADHIEAEYHETTYAMMTRDGLTGAFTRRYFEEALRRDLARSKRSGQPLSLMMFDVDQFKTINDQFGHLAADRALIDLTRRILTILSTDHIMARFGGDEFIVLLSDTNYREAQEIAEICRAVAELDTFGGVCREFSVTISVGVAAAFLSEDGNLVLDSPHPSLDNAPMFNQSDVSFETLLACVDAWMYEAKSDGRNRVR
ncbi:diguanylate cyclase domain-containing protein [Thalassoroseus pseudoceratinae]|uniref:diguanylate cyclase domain-containing protein n=1 Tax=Thalassoroseus pseudoceratinae TaxID=2713176 RepID=UPI001421B1C8|nr:GGDEF domain-containing protein [Thalassoroseus pseudoceratinae]